MPSVWQKEVSGQWPQANSFRALGLSLLLSRVGRVLAGLLGGQKCIDYKVLIWLVLEFLSVCLSMHARTQTTVHFLHGPPYSYE